jgi:DedD protein
MRFEIGPGGMFVILLGLIGLSGAVFGLGLIAGHELSGSEPGAQPVAAAFPLPAAPGAPPPAPAAPPAPKPAAVAAAPIGAGATTTPASENAEPKAATAAANPPANHAVASGHLPDMAESPEAGGPAKHKKGAAAKTAVATRERPSAGTDTSDEDLAPGDAVAPPSKAGAAATDSGSTNPGDEDEDNTESSPPLAAPPVHKKVAALDNPPPTNPQQPYSIQIDAVMDRQGAQQMVHKLRAKGFQPFMVPTQVGGKTWYRLRVGHYATPDEAQAAEAKLHQEFNDTPASH